MSRKKYRYRTYKRMTAILLSLTLGATLLPGFVTPIYAAPEDAAAQDAVEDPEKPEQEQQENTPALSFEETAITYTLGTRDGLVSDQSVTPSDPEQPGTITYDAILSESEGNAYTLEAGGLSLDGATGRITVSDPGKLAGMLKDSEDGKLTVQVTATRAADGEQDIPEATASYTIQLQFAPVETAEGQKAYRLLDPDGQVLTEPNGTDGWYRTAVTVEPADKEAYQIGTEAAGTFSDAIRIDDQGGAERRVYLKNRETGALSAPIVLTELTKLDSVAPDELTISYGESVSSRVIEALTFGFYDAPVQVTLTGRDETSGIVSFHWSYQKREGAGDSVLSLEEGNVEAESVASEPGLYQATFSLPAEDAAEAQLQGSLTVQATDAAGSESGELTDEQVLVVDTVAPVGELTHAPAGPDVQVNDADPDHVYYSGDATFTFRIQEANFYPEDAKVLVSRDGGEAQEREVSWEADASSDGHTASLTLEEEGDYVVTLQCQDPSGHKMEDITSPLITVDKTAPVVTFAYSNGNQETGDPANAQEAVITVTEHNFRPADLSLTVTAENRDGEPVDTVDFQAYLQKAESWVREGDTYTARIREDFADAIYTMTLQYQDPARNAADPVASGRFLVDHTAPEADKLQITYEEPLFKSLLSGITFGFYNPKVTVTFTAEDPVSGVDHFTWSYHREKGASTGNVEQYADQILPAVQEKSDPSLFTASVTLPLKEAEQLRGSLEVFATDRYGNVSDTKTDSGHVLVVDTIAPALTAEYTDVGRVVDQTVYSNQDLTVNFCVTEANFFPEDVKLELSRDGGAYEEVTPVWTEQEGDRHVGAVTIHAPADHSGDGTYIFRITYRDRSQNQMETYTSRSLVIDTVKPVIQVTYDETQKYASGQDWAGHSRDYYKETRTALLTVTEEHFVPEEVELSIEEQDVNGASLEGDRRSSVTDWTVQADQYSRTLTYPGDANYTFDVSYTDLAGNAAEDYPADYFTVDGTPPTGLQVSYSTSVLDTVLGGISFGFYQAPVTVTIRAEDSISGVHSFRYSYRKAADVSRVNAELKDQKIEEEAIHFSGDRTVGTAEFTIPRDALDGDHQFHGTVAFDAADRSGNQTKEWEDSKRIVVDNIAPTATIAYNEPVRTEDGIAYYDRAVEATLTVEEANFYPEDLEITVTQGEDLSYPVTASWEDESPDVHVGTFSLEQDGDYVISIRYQDKSANRMAEYTSGQLTVDTVLAEPVITINGEEGNGKAYREEVIPAVAFEDVNFESCELSLTRTRYEKQGEDVTEEFLGDRLTRTETGGSGVFDTFAKKEENDGIYTLQVRITDKAGHEAKSSCTFTVNRFGSVYAYDSYLNSLIGDGGAYVRGLEEDLIITEYNADRLISGSAQVDISRDGRPLEEVSYRVTPEINDQAAPGSSGWYQYQYTIDRENFAADGVYRLSIASADATGNHPDSVTYREILFRVDSTPPEINRISGLEKAIVNASQVPVTYDVYDTIGLASVQIYVGERLVEEVTDFSGDANQYEGSFTLKEASEAQHVRLVVTDKAGNVTDTDSEAFRAACAFPFRDTLTISTSFFVRSLAWAKAHGKVLALSGGAGIVLILGFLGWRSWKRRKKKTEEEETQE